jgi:AbrB family looped-hinge helix DNA binding protein
MAKEVVVTRRGQTTIPKEYRQKLGIRGGSKLKVDIEGEKITFTKVPSLFELAGTSKLSREEAYRRLDMMREEG